MTAAWASMVAQLIGVDAACHLPKAGRGKRHRPSDKPPSTAPECDSASDPNTASRTRPARGDLEHPDT